MDTYQQRDTIRASNWIIALMGWIYNSPSDIGKKTIVLKMLDAILQT